MTIKSALIAIVAVTRTRLKICGDPAKGNILATMGMTLIVTTIMAKEIMID